MSCPKADVMSSDVSKVVKFLITKHGTEAAQIFILIPTHNYQRKIQTQIPEFELGFWRGIDSTHEIFSTSPSTFDALRHQIDARQSVTKIGVR
jgi:hypothetical protein